MRLTFFAWLGLALVGCGTTAKPTLLPDAPAPHPPAIEAAVSLPLRPLNAKASPEKGPPPGVCDYPGTFVPCWCGHLWGFGSCDSAEEYEESVQQFGPPRAFVAMRRTALVVTYDE